MSLIAKSNGNESNFVPVPVGMHLARCYKVIDLGTQQKSVQGSIKHQRTVMLQFEVHGDGPDGPMVTSKGEPMSIAKDYNLTLNEKSNLSADLESWRGARFSEADRNGGFDIKKILGVWAMINVTSSVGKGNGKTYHNISAINSVPKMIKDVGLPAGFNQLEFFSMSDDSPNMDAFNGLSQYHQNKIKLSPEWAAINGLERPASSSSPSNPYDDDDIPF